MAPSATEINDGEANAPRGLLPSSKTFDFQMVPIKPVQDKPITQVRIPRYVADKVA